MAREDHAPQSHSEIQADRESSILYLGTFSSSQNGVKEPNLYKRPEITKLTKQNT